MAGTVTEQGDELRWFFGALAVAVLFTYWLASVDTKLSTSDSEQVLGRELLRLRTAQTELPSRVTDSRQLSPFVETSSR